MATFLVCYDISATKGRNRVARLLEKYGERLQRSVFRLDVSLAVMERLKTLLLHALDDQDELLVIPLCERCQKDALRSGPAVPLLYVA